MALCGCAGDYHVLLVDVLSVSGIFRGLRPPHHDSLKWSYRLNMSKVEMGPFHALLLQKCLCALHPSFTPFFSAPSQPHLEVLHCVPAFFDYPISQNPLGLSHSVIGF